MRPRLLLLLFLLFLIIVVVYINNRKARYQKTYSFYPPEHFIIANNEYYFPGKTKVNNSELDKYGYLITDYRAGLGKQYNPVAIATYALKLSSDLKDPMVKESFLKQLEWLDTNKKYINKYDAYTWEFKFDWLENNEHAPWVSSMAQGLILSAYVRAYKLTAQSPYLDTADKVLNSFRIPVAEGGIKDEFSNDQYIYKEYPHYKYVVLDGFLISLAGILEYYYATKSEEAKKFLDCGLNFLINHIDKFTAKWFECGGVYYSSMGDCASSGYYDADLKWLKYLETYDKRLLEISKKWMGVSNNLYCIFYRHIKNRILYTVHKNATGR